MKQKRYCKLEYCYKKYRTRGYCTEHYLKFVRDNRDILDNTPRRKQYNNRSAKPEYRVWVNMKQRCLNPNNPHYKNYGARGINILPEWQENFDVFYDYIGPRPNEDMTIERINNDLGYVPDNIKWATRLEQTHNRRNTKATKHIYKKTGVYFNTHKKRYIARINKNNRQIELGRFKTEAEARLCVLEYRKAL